jgi:RNA-directed DNA polymerase
MLVGEYIEPCEVGTPQGGPLSPLLTNIMLNQLDRELQRRGHRFARYADDVIILVRSARAAQRVMRSITRYLETPVKLKGNPAKSKVASMGKCSFLGFTIKDKKIRWTDKALADFKPGCARKSGICWTWA